MAAQCVCQDIDASRLVGIPVDTVIVAIYALGGFFGVAGGILFAMYFNAVFIQMGLLATTKAWAAAMIGGIGNFQGAFLGGLILGVAETASVVVVGSAYRDGVSLLIIVLVLLVRPNGLFGSAATERS
jgi:branched-chain amino acid transport system permease protein